MVSIIICCFNGVNFIERCFSCLLEQTYKKLEIIFIDDGSYDGSYKKAFEYNSNFHKKGMLFKCFRQKNKGAGGAAALGIYHANGKFIMCYDIDDILYPTSIEKQVSFLKNNPDYAIVRTNGYHTNGIKKELFVTSEQEKEKTNIFTDLLLGKTNNWAGSYMIRSQFLWKVYPNHRIIESRYGQNLQLLLAVAYNNKSGFIDQPLMEYVYNPNSFTNKKQDLHSQLKNYNGYKSIRLAIVKKLNITDDFLLKALEVCYLEIFIDLAITYNNKDLFYSFYKELKAYKSLSFIHKYYYNIYQHNKILSFYYKVLLFLCKR